MANATMAYALRVGGDRLTPVNAAEALGIVERWAMEHEEANKNGKTLVEVDLSCRSYRLTGVEVIVNFLHSSPDILENVQIARLDDLIASLEESVGLQVLKQICDCFRDCTLTHVDLSDNALGLKGVEACEGVLLHQSELEELHFRAIGLAMESMQELADQLKGSQHLRVLHFFNNNVGVDGAMHFADILRTCPNLEDIRYSNARASVDGSKAVMKALRENESVVLKKLDLGCSSFEGDGLKHLIAVMERSHELTSLDLEDCGLTDARMNQLCTALMDAEAPLEYLNLSINLDGEDDEDGFPIAADCTDTLASLIFTVRDSLKELNLDTNFLTSYGANRIMEAFNDEVENAPLERLFFDENQLGHGAAVALQKAAPFLPNLREIKLSENGFALRDVARLEEAFGDKLTLEDNDEQADFDRAANGRQDEQLEQELAEANAAPQQEDGNDLRGLSQMMTQYHL